MPLQFLADMNLLPLTISALRREDYHIRRLSDLLSFDATDADILALARQQGMVIITQDLDFSALLALGEYRSPGIVTLCLTNTRPDTVTQRLKQVLPHVEMALLEGSTVTVEDAVVRIRKLPVR